MFILLVIILTSIISNIKVHQIGSSPNPLELAQIIFPAGFASHGVLDKDPTVWLNGARPPPKA